MPQLPKRAFFLCPSHFLESLIIYFKEVDRKDLLQEYYLDLSFNCSKTNRKLETIYEDISSDLLLYNNEKLEKNTIDKYINVTKKNQTQYYLPEKRNVNLKDPKLRKKGLVTKEKSINNINEN